MSQTMENLLGIIRMCREYYIPLELDYFSNEDLILVLGLVQTEQMNNNYSAPQLRLRYNNTIWTIDNIIL